MDVEDPRRLVARGGGIGSCTAPPAVTSIRTWLAANVNEAVAKATRIQYGGSLKGANAEGLLKQPDIDGGLIGGAARRPDPPGDVGDIDIDPSMLPERSEGSTSAKLPVASVARDEVHRCDEVWLTEPRWPHVFPLSRILPISSAGDPSRPSRGGRSSISPNVSVKIWARRCWPSSLQCISREITRGVRCSSGSAA